MIRAVPRLGPVRTVARAAKEAVPLVKRRRHDWRSAPNAHSWKKTSTSPPPYF